MSKPPIIIKNTMMLVQNYDLGEALKLENSLSYWNRYTHSMVPLGYDYDVDKRELYLPRGMDVNYVKHTLDRVTHIEHSVDKHDTIEMNVINSPRNNVQQRSIEFLTGTGEFTGVKGSAQLALTLTTGTGKTFCTVTAIAQLRKRSLILTHNKRIKDQWETEFLTHSDIKPEEICHITGTKGIEAVMKRLTNKRMKVSNPYKVFICTRRTLTTYGKKYGWDMLGDFINMLSVGVKVYDEAHLEFEAIRNIDFHTNTWKTFYLTANLEKSDYKEHRVFKTYFQHIPEFGRDVSEMEMEKNIIYLPVLYDSKPEYGETLGLFTGRGLSVTKYADYMMDNRMFRKVFEEMFLKFLGMETMQGKILIMSSSIVSTEKMADFVREITENRYSVGTYHSEMDPDEREENLESCAIICTTPKALGTGTDIANLRLVINTEPYKSRVTANQISGRLRNTNDKIGGMYVEFVDMAIDTCREFYKERLKFFKTKVLSVAVTDKR